MNKIYWTDLIVVLVNN